MRFDNGWQTGGTPYAGRHRKGWLPLLGRRPRGYLQRLGRSRKPASAPGQRRAHRGLPAVYDEQHAAGR